jgi:hypothetical protein
MLLTLLSPQPASDGSSTAGSDLSFTALALLPRLGARAYNDIASWLTPTDIYSYFDEAAKRLAERCGIFVERDTSIVLTPGIGQYNLVARSLSTLHVSISGARLRPVSAAELDALDPLWPDAVAPAGEQPTRYSLDVGPLGTITTYPRPGLAGAIVATINHVYPLPVVQDSTVIPIPAPVADYFLYFALMRARSKQSEQEMPEAVALAEARLTLYEQVLRGYYGVGR